MHSLFPRPKSRNIASIFLFVVMLGLAIRAIGQTQPEPASTRIDFKSQIAPILRDRCLSCHGPETAEGSLRLDSREAALRGGDSGEVLIAGSWETSILHQRIMASDESRMPPKGAPLTPQQQELIRLWIAQGADWPQSESSSDPRLEHWAWQPLQEVPIPEVSTQLTNLKRWTENPIDHFIAQKLIENGLEPSIEADPQILVRRLYFDLHGLPPTADQVKAYLENRSPNRYQELVDELLASPAYGERWARHWLDIAHYADTHGFERDQRRDHAWRYRDYVIDSWNHDKPYDLFLKQQIAGDVLNPSDPEHVIASSFLAVGPWDFVGQAETPSPTLKRLARADDLDDMVTQVMTSACGITINCARCHNHKLDPISQREYYSLWSVFAGVKRGDRLVSVDEEQQSNARRAQLQNERGTILTELATLEGKGLQIADLVGGGNGYGSGEKGKGIDPLTGKSLTDRRGFLEGVIPNQILATPYPVIHAVFIPDGSASSDAIAISSSGVLTKALPATGRQAWDAIRNGPVNSQFSTSLAGVDYNAPEYSLLSMHANAAMTLDLQQLPADETRSDSMSLVGDVGYFGETPKNGASVHILLDGQPVFAREKFGRDDGLQHINLSIDSSARFITLIASDGGNGIGHDQVGFVNLRLIASKPEETEPIRKRREELRTKRTLIEQELAAIAEPRKVYGVVAEQPPPVHVLNRGNTEDPKEQVLPGAVDCFAGWKLQLPDSASDAERRIAFAQWITDTRNPLPARVIANRLWYHHFSAGLVATPSDFGLGGARPTHPELLDWLAGELIRHEWSLKHLQREICLSATYRQSSIRSSEKGEAIDAGNRFLWRQTPRRLDAESLRDSVLATSGALNRSMYGPGFRDFDYQEEYAPVYRYRVIDQPEQWRRTVYRFLVRTTMHPFLTTLDCPNPANLTPARNITTTPLQSLALLNNEFILLQADYFAKRVAFETGEDAASQVDTAFHRAFSRPPTPNEREKAVEFVKQHGLQNLCRMLLNANEFIYID